MSPTSDCGSGKGGGGPTHPPKIDTSSAWILTVGVPVFCRILSKGGQDTNQGSSGESKNGWYVKA